MSVITPGKSKVSRLTHAQDPLADVQRADCELASEPAYAELYRQERTTRIAAQEASNAKDRILALVAHELRTPLNAILGWAQWATDPRLDDRQRQEALGKIESSAIMQARLIEDLLDTARILIGKLRLDMRPLDFGAVIASAVDMVGPVAKAKGISLTAVITNGRAALVRGDELRLRQVMANLLGNAVKFTPSGGAVRVDLETGGSFVQARVIDNGRGIKADFLPRIFARFQQERADARNGLGLGLSLAYYIVELHGGTIHADSDGPGRGAAFTVILPATHARDLDEPQDATTLISMCATADPVLTDLAVSMT